MKFQHPVPQMKGIVKLTVRDAETLEIKREQEQENAIALGATLWGLMSLENNNWLSSLVGDYNNVVNGNNIMISERKSAPGLITNLGAPQSPATTTIAQASSIIQPWTFFTGSPDYAETVRRFNQPGTARVINTIYVGNGVGTYRRPFSTAGLATPCTQSTSEVLDVTYRIQFFYQTPDPTGHPVAVGYGQSLAHKTTTGSQQAFPRNQAFYMFGPPVDGLQFHGTTGNFAGSEGESGVYVIHPRYAKVRHDLNQTISTNIGQVIRSVGYGYNSSLTTNMLGGALGGIRTPLWAPLTPDAFPNKPIQTIHNHNAGAIEPWLDVDFLTTGQGTLTVDGSAWTNPGDWPEFWRIDHTLSGQVGVSRYMLRKRVTVGFNGNTYRSNRTNIFHTMWQNDATPENLTVVGGHGLRQVYNWNEYDHETVVKWDSGGVNDPGITVCRINSPEVVNFDPTTTPALPVTGGVRQCSTDTNGNIWVADSSSGLYKITDPFGSPTVTKMTEASNSLPVGSENNCYGVAVGFGGDILAVVNGGLIRTSNPNGATPTFAAESFTHTGITDSNWDRVDYLVVDPESPTFDSILVRSTTGVMVGAQQHVWWSTAQAAGIAGTTGSTVSIFDSKGGSRFGRVKCSRRGSMWSYHGPSAAAAGAMRFLYFGTATVVTPTGLGSTGHASPTFMYDYYDTPYMYNCEANNDFGPGVWSPMGGIGSDGKVFSRGERGAVSSNFVSYSGSYFGFEDPISNGLWFNNNVSSDSLGENTQYPMMLYQHNPIDAAQINGSEGALNGQYSPNEEIFWDKYHWNGASWVKNFFEPATDTGTHAGGPYAGDRHNFDTEDHTFTGRSMIDATTAMAASNFASSANATFAFKLIPDAKLSTASDASVSMQEKPRVLLDLSDETQQFQIVWDDDIQGNITIVEDGDGGTVIASTPTNGSTYRLVVTVAGTAVSVYLDGNTTPIGTVTLANAFDWDNGDGKLKAFIGCAAYFWPNPQRNSTWEHNFYRGVMENVQFWNVAWNTTDVTNDFGDIDGVIVSQPAANLVARYQLTQSLVGTETKLTHAGAEALVDGVTIAFTNGASPTAFIGGDYHTFGVVDGIFKDNAIAFTQNYDNFFKPTDFNFTDFDNGAAGNTIVATTTAIVDEPAMWVHGNPSLDFTISGTGVADTHLSRIYETPGQAAAGFRSGTAGHSQVWGTQTAQPITGDGYFQAGPQHDNEDVIIGLSDNPGTSHTQANIDFGIRLRLDGTVDIIELGVTNASAVATYVIGDIFRVRKIGTAITYYKVVSGIPTLIHTSATTSSNTLYGKVSFYQQGYGVREATITYTRPARVLSIGDPATFTGIYDPKFYIVDGDQPQSLNINIGGSPATVVVSNTHYDAMAVPAAGEVVVNDRMGWLIFNSADDGAAITGNVTVIYNET